MKSQTEPSSKPDTEDARVSSPEGKRRVGRSTGYMFPYRKF